MSDRIGRASTRVNGLTVVPRLLCTTVPVTVVARGLLCFFFVIQVRRHVRPQIEALPISRGKIGPVTIPR